MRNKETLKVQLLNASKRISDIAEGLPKKLSEIKSSDTSGRDDADIFKIIDLLSTKFQHLANEIDTPFKIAVVGSQGTGKSTLVNLLLGESLMPSTSLENESAVIRLAYPLDDTYDGQACFELIDDTTCMKSIAEAISIIDKNQRSITEDAFVKAIKYVTFYIRSEKLRKIELINTPGMNVITDDFYPKVQHLFTKADIIIWVNSGEQILDDFNSWLIKKIHADNDKIVGLITFPDKLYRQDENTGVTDVVTQFMEQLEKGKLIRVNNKVGLFIFNGNFAQISESHKSNAKFINDINDLEADEAKLRMLFNFLHHGFAYSDDASNWSILENYGFYGLESGVAQGQLEDHFELNSFYNYSLREGFCELSADGASALYTEKGRVLLGEASQYHSFGRFAEEELMPMSEKSKFLSVQDRLNRILSKSASEDTSISRLIQIRDELERRKEELGQEDQKQLNSFKETIIILKNEYKEWYNNQIGHQTNLYSDKLIDAIVKEIEEKINPGDLFKEIGRSLIPPFLRKNESAVSVKLSNIITVAVERILPDTLEKIAEEANSQIELILIKMHKNYLSDKNDFKTKNNSFHFDPSLNFDASELIKKILKHLKPLLKKILIDLAKRDLRKGSNNFMKKNLIKPVVKLIRKLIAKFGLELAKKQAQNVAAKGGMGPAGLALLIIDIALAANDLHKMYKEIKESLKSQLKAEASFNESFKEEAVRLYTSLIDEVEKDLTDDFAAGRSDLSFIITGITAVNHILDGIELLSEQHTNKDLIPA